MIQLFAAATWPFVDILLNRTFLLINSVQPST